MRSSAFLFGILVIFYVTIPGLAAPAEEIKLLTITPGPHETTHEPCLRLPCPFVPNPERCTSIKTTYFEWHGQLCPGCPYCVMDSTIVA